MEVAEGNEWSNTAALLHIRKHLQDDACGRENHSTLEEVFKALRSKFGLSIGEARTRLTNINRHQTLIGGPRYRDQEIGRRCLCRPTKTPPGGDDSRFILQLSQPRILPKTSLGHQTRKSGEGG